jgi:excisionase family DNA binding protein
MAGKEVRVEERHLSLSEAAEALDISERTAYRWVKSGKLRAYKPGRDYWIPESAIRGVVEGSEVRPKAPGRSSPEPSLFNGFEDERRTAEAEVIADYEPLTREYRIAWRDALNALAAAGEDLLESGAFERSRVEQFFTGVAAVSGSVSRALRATIEEETTLHLKYKQVTTAEHIEEMRATAISPAGARLLGISDRVLAAAVERFPSDELASVRSKHDEVRRALRAVA